MENGAAHGNILLSFKWDPIALKLKARVGNFYLPNITDFFTDVDLTVHLPSNYDTEEHYYTVRMYRNIAVFGIDGKPVLFVIPCEKDVASVLYDNSKPYSLAFIGFMPSSVTGFTEILTNRTEEAPDELKMYIPPYGFRLSDGNPVPQMQLPLYVEASETCLRGYSVDSGTVISHPFPTLGFNRKTIYFMSDQAGTLSIKVYTLSGSWREYDSIPISADSLEVYNMVGEALITRIEFTPDTYPATINEAEVLLS